MTLNEYQKAAMRTARDGCYDLNNAALGLAGEAGEFCDLIKKFTYQGKTFNSEHLKKELGDIMWYISLATSALNTSLDEIAQINVDKLMARYPDGFDPIRANNRQAGDI